MSMISPGRTVWIERATIIFVTFAYLLVFNRITPHGDALRVVRQIDDGQLLWNPNHLAFDPIGYAWYALLKALAIPVSPLGSFEIIAGAAAIVSLLIFHALLLRLGIKRASARLLSTGGLFASQAFLTMAISQYYFMVQMPFLLGALYQCVVFVEAEHAGAVTASHLRRAGLLTAAAATIAFNDVLLVGALGLAVALPRPGERDWRWANLANVWGPAAALGFPVFLVGYVLSGTNTGFTEWLLSYEGSAGTNLTSFYGMEWTPRGVAVSMARAAFNLLSASVVETAGIGTALRALVLREPVEFVPEASKLVLTAVLAPVVSLAAVALLIWMARRTVSDRLAQISVAWIASFVVFNILWNSTGGQFWVQVLPPMWIGLVGNVSGRYSLRVDDLGDHEGRGRWKVWASAFAVPSLLLVNTLQTVVPVSWVDLEELRTRHMTLLRDGDLEILPGWDGIGWVQIADGGPRITRETLMDMALQTDTHGRHISHLPEIVARHLGSGNRVIVARLYDKDRGINPWYGLARLGWPRARIQELLVHYCSRELGTVDDVVFREITICQP